MEEHYRGKRIVGLTTLASFALALVAAWLFTPLSELASLERASSLVRGLAQSDLAWLCMLLLLAALALAFVPVTLLTTATALAFDRPRRSASRSAARRSPP